MRLIFARDPLGGIGNHGSIPWSDAVEMRLFKVMTRGATLISGRKTANTLPILTGRRVIVVGNPERFTDYHLADRTSVVKETHPRICVPSLDEATKATRTHTSVWLIGGAALFQSALKANLVTEVHESVMQVIYPSDTFFKPDWASLGFELEKTQRFPTFTHYKWIRTST